MSLTNKINILSEIDTGDNTIKATALSEGLTESAASTMTYSVGSLKYSIITGSGETQGYYQCDGIDGEAMGAVVIASEIDGIAVKGIKIGAFRGATEVTSVTIPDTIVTIGSLAFAEMNITYIAIPNSVKEIGMRAFEGCSELEYAFIYDGSNLTNLGQSAFSRCTALKNIKLPDSLISMGTNAFYGCTSLFEATIGAGLTEIPASAFDGCSGLLKCNMGESVERIGSYAFANCSKLLNIEIPQNVNWISAKAFSQSGLTKLTLDDPNGWFFTDSNAVPTEIKDGETCTHVAEVRPVLLTTQFVDKNWFKLDQIPAPTISINDGILTVTDYSGLAETFKIYVNAGDPIEVPVTLSIVPGTWVANDEIDTNHIGNAGGGISFTSVDGDGDEYSFGNIIVSTSGLSYVPSDGSSRTVYSGGAWLNLNSKTIVVTSVNASLFGVGFEPWFLANFTLCVDSGDSGDNGDSGDDGMITFTCRDVECTAPVGMTWEEWINSDYFNSSADVWISEGYVETTGSVLLTDDGNGEDVKASDVIIDGAVYNR